MTDEEIIKTAANMYGINHQTDKMIEEMSELTKAFIKFRHKRNAESRVCDRSAVIRAGKA